MGYGAWPSTEGLVEALRNADDEPPRPLKVTFSEPAEYWVDAIPIGNGRLGAMIWGCVPSEKLQLNGKSINHFLLIEAFFL